MDIVKFSIWINVPSKYMGGFICHCFCYCGYIFRKIIFFFVFGISLAVVKTDVKCHTE